MPVLHDDDREEWDRAWRASPHRRLPSPPRAGLPREVSRRFGEPSAITLFLDPPEYAGRNPRPSATCPVCGGATSGPGRLPASLNVAWAGGLRLGFGVWVHPDCFEACPDADAPAPLPW